MSQSNPDAPKQAREQAKAYNSIFAPHQLKLDNGDVIEVPPHPNLRMFDDEAQAEYDQFELELEAYDRHPDVAVPEQNVYDKKGLLVCVMPPETRPGGLKVPHRKTDKDGKVELLNPPYNVRVAQIALGSDYEKLRASTIDGRRGSATDVWRIWNEQGSEMIRRRADDAKSDGGSDDLADVSPSDSK